MIEKPMDIRNQFPVRKSSKQKEAFRNGVMAYARNLGYSVSIERGNMGCRNVVIGNPETAQYLITAHYDTPASIGLPNILTPCNLLIYILWQVFIVAIFFLAAIVPGVIVGFCTNNPQIAGISAFMIYWGLLILMLVGPANKNNANDNTSGVVTLLETAATWPKEARSQVCFVLFDLEEAGLIGSSVYRKTHKQSSETQIVFNLDCVGDGDEILLFPMKKLRKSTDKMALLRSFNGVREEKRIHLHEKGFAVYPSDQKQFPYGVGIASFRRMKCIGLYCSRIHTAQDTVLDEKNVYYLRDTLLKLARVSVAK